MRLSIFLCLLIFSLRLNAQAPLNDEACTATVLTVSNACSFLTATNENATTSPEADPGCGNYNGGDVWFQLVVPPTGIVTVTTQPGSTLQMALWPFTQAPALRLLSSTVMATMHRVEGVCLKLLLLD